MMIMITLQYIGCDGGYFGILDVWNLTAPSVAAVQHLVDEELGPALRRHGRRCVLERGVDPATYLPEALVIEVSKSPLYSVQQICREIADDRGMPRLSDRHLNRFRRARATIKTVPPMLVALLSKHGIRDANGKTSVYRPKAKPCEQSWTEDEPPF